MRHNAHVGDGAVLASHTYARRNRMLTTAAVGTRCNFRVRRYWLYSNLPFDSWGIPNSCSNYDPLVLLLHITIFTPPIGCIVFSQQNTSFNLLSECICWPSRNASTMPRSGHGQAPIRFSTGKHHHQHGLPLMLKKNIIIMLTTDSCMMICSRSCAFCPPSK